MKKRFWALLLALALCLTLCPAALAAEPDRSGPLSEDAAPTVLDTGRGYIVYYFYTSAIYYSDDGVDWIDLSDRQWVKDAGIYTQLFVGSLGGHREFQIIWTGSEYMMRQSLRDDPRATHQRYGDSPRNSVVTFLDTDLQVIGEMAFDAAVSDIRFEGDTYYATVDGEENAFARSDWDTRFSDVPAGSWFEQGVATCAKNGIMVGVGEGLFAPDKELSQAECLTLALRLYDLMRGNDLTVETAPADWGKLTFTLADGTVFEGYGCNSDVGDEFNWWEYKNDYRGVYVQVPGWDHEDMEAGHAAQQAWRDAHVGVGDSGADAPATLALNGVTYQGTSHCWLPVGPYVLQFQPDEYDEVNAILRHAVYREVGPDRWWRDVCYTVVQRELEDIFSPYDFNTYAASRGFFTKTLAAGCGDSLEKRFTVEAIPDLPRKENGTQTDAYRSAAYALYEAGVLTGTDEHGTFDADGALTRAQAAVMVARVLDESQRMDTPPAPMTGQGYTLTYLMDGSPDYAVRYPVCVLGGSEENEGHSGVLLLDGTLLPWPGNGEGTPSYALDPRGDYVYFGVYDLTTEDPYDTRCGLMDRNGDFIVPMENGRTQSTYAIEGGFFSRVCPTDGSEVWILLDENGQLVREVPVEDADPESLYPPKARQPYQGIQATGNMRGETGYHYYVDADGNPISQHFDWAGPIGADGAGFVGLEGKIYRIEFEK